MSDIVEQLRDKAFRACGPTMNAIHTRLVEWKAADAIEALRAENNAYREECSSLKNELAKWVNYWRDKDVKALRAENAKLKEALNPFAVVAEMTIGESEDDRDLFRPAHNGPRLIVADFRKAVAAMGDDNGQA